jgi:hypothetical protein
MRFTLKRALDVLYQPNSHRREVPKQLLPGVLIVLERDPLIFTYKGQEYLTLAVNDEPWYHARPVEILQAVAGD